MTLILRQLSLLSLAIAGASASRVDPSRYDSGEPWTTLKNGVEFQPAIPESSMSPLSREHLRRLTTVDKDAEAFQTMYTNVASLQNYNEAAQAWRALGFYIDCDYGDNTNYNINNNNYYEYNNNYNAAGGVGSSSGLGCQRFILWAAYVDEGYSGNGMGEYQYYDRHSNQWDDSACRNVGNSQRCMKMDCHLPDTHFSLLGYFKEPRYDEWLNQLISHQGDCVWTDEEYQLMKLHQYQLSRQAWPTGSNTGSCIQTRYNHNGQTIYYDLKPSMYGDMGIGMYTDERCTVEYTGLFPVGLLLHGMICGGYVIPEGADSDWDNLEDEIDRLCNSNTTGYTYIPFSSQGETSDSTAVKPWSLDQELAAWNDAFDAFKQCQPCKTFDLTSSVAGIGYKKNSDGTRYGDNYDDDSDKNEDEEEEEENKEDGENDDDATQDEDYTEETYFCHDNSVKLNQCKKFATATDVMMTATWRDVEMAEMQGSITSVPSPHSSSSFQRRPSFGSNRVYAEKAVTANWILLLVSAVLCASSAVYYKTAVDDRNDEARRHKALLRQPLVPEPSGTLSSVATEESADDDDDDEEADHQPSEEGTKHRPRALQNRTFRFWSAATRPNLNQESDHTTSSATTKAATNQKKDSLPAWNEKVGYSF